jgi:hypothetical protein
MQYSLDRAIHDAKFSNGQHTLTDEQQAAIFQMLATRCRSATKAQLGRRLEMPLSLWPSYGIFSRLILRDDQTSRPYYITGQDWNVERATLRDLILKG